jgi:transcriptional antiterminator NusG
MGFTKWYTLRVLSGKENKVKELLPHTEDYDKHIEEVLIPNEKTIRLRGNKKIVVTKNLLSGYMFIKFKGTPDPDFVKSLEQTKFVSSFLKNEKGQPVPIKDEEFAKIVGNVEVSYNRISQLSKGEKIIVTDGPFQKFEGTVMEIDAEKQKLKVLVKVFGRPTTLDLNLSQVERPE